MLCPTVHELDLLSTCPGPTCSCVLLVCEAEVVHLNPSMQRRPLSSPESAPVRIFSILPRLFICRTREVR